MDRSCCDEGRGKPSRMCGSGGVDLAGYGTAKVTIQYVKLRELHGERDEHERNERYFLP